MKFIEGSPTLHESQQHFRNPDGYFRGENRFLRLHAVKKVSTGVLLARPGQFPRRNSLAVLTEVHLGPCVYASLTLKCSHKLDSLAAKSWKNLSVRVSFVYIIVVLTKRIIIKKENHASFLAAYVVCLRLRDCRQIIFLLPDSSAKTHKFATILILSYSARFR